VHWVFCVFRGGHQPLRLALSTTRMVCGRCGIELDNPGTPLACPVQPQMPPTTITRRTRKPYR
jgi:hypothetical protein